MSVQGVKKETSVPSDYKTIHTTADAMLETLQENGVKYIFANLGSDHPAIIESFAKAKYENKDTPQVITCPHEFVAMSAAHGYAMLTGEPQAVIVHVDCGTQNLGGAIHNAAKARIPILIFAGTSPATQEGELKGSRNEYIHWLQDSFDQRGIVRGYAKYDNEIRTGKNIKQMVTRAMQIAKSDPKGPAYLMAAREVMEDEVETYKIDLKRWGSISAAAIPDDRIQGIAGRLLKADKPLIVTSYLGRNQRSVQELIKLSERLAIPVLESVPSYMNFPSDNPMHIGYTWNEQDQNEHLAEADFILVLDSDVPWIPFKNKPSEKCDVVIIDIDPLKEDIPLWYIQAEGFYKADSFTALSQINSYLNQHERIIDESSVSKRYKTILKIHQGQRREWKAAEYSFKESIITPEMLTGCLREVLNDEDIVICEAITNFSTVTRHLPRNKPGTYFSPGASSLGWSGGAAFGAKLAEPDKLVVALTGDGSFMFSNPTPLHWMSGRYEVPFLTIIYNNEGWTAPKYSTLGVHPNGVAQQTDEFFVKFNPAAKYADIAKAAGGTFAYTVKKPEEVKDTLLKAINTVKHEGKSAVVDVRLPQG
ncbi:MULTISPECIES: thiamine pyrophosphate-requiring protein [Cytobacillus]|uniref:thiamine pyrophosphate-requiring protein n=1 Tax=Cytobacillus TaxID=2675230 RepID=UPI002040EE64|nr:thiamine pyrophosphate-requiring protein [Cytobacillus firmus]MCM3706613.1 thiamine pyrophosphate-requiring protein [Cytobacillus firmus]